MENFLILTSILGVHLLATMSPGPDFVVAIKNSLIYSRKTGLRTAVGFGLGIGVHVTYCVLGLAILISQSIMLFTAIKLLGAGYLMRIGATALLSRGGGSGIDLGTISRKKDISPIAAIRQGFLTNILNPKATLFFLGLFTMVITPTIPSWVVLTASVMMVVNTILRFGLVSIFMTNSIVRRKVERRQSSVTRILGGALVALGVKIAFTE